MRVGDELYLVRAGADDLVIRDAEPVDHALVALLSREERTLDELRSHLAVEAGALRAKIDALDSAGVLALGATSPPLPPVDAERFSRQLPYLAEYGDERELQRRLARVRVAVLGCGGLGTWALAALAAAGVRRFRLVDHDVVELSNLNRQAIYRPDQLGRPKVEAAADWLRRFDSRIDVEPVRERVDGVPAARRAIDDANALVFTADHPPYILGRWVNAACVSAKVPFISAGQVPPAIRVGPLYTPGEAACLVCHETALRAESIAYDGYVEHVQASPNRSATLGPASAIVGSIVAMELMHLFVGVKPATTGAALTIDIRTLAVRRDPVPRDSRCEACGVL